MSLHGSASDHRGAMDRIYRTQRHIYDLTRKYYLLGRDRLIEELQPPAGGRVLELGCGTGRNLVLAARRYPQARCFGVDISDQMLETARAKVAKAGLSGRIRLAQGDASAVDTAQALGEPQFERVFISYALSMIPPWQATARHALELVAPGGSLHIVDFGAQSDLPDWFGRGLRSWLARFDVTPREGLESELSALAAASGAGLTFERLYRDYAQLAVLRKA